MYGHLTIVSIARVPTSECSPLMSSLTPNRFKATTTAILVLDDKAALIANVLRPFMIALPEECNQSILIGRNKDLVSIVLESSLSPKMISRVHCEIVLIISKYCNSESKSYHNLSENVCCGYYIVDQKGPNGILLNNCRLNTYRKLRYGDKIIFGGAGSIKPDENLENDKNLGNRAEFSYIVNIPVKNCVESLCNGRCCLENRDRNIESKTSCDIKSITEVTNFGVNTIEKPATSIVENLTCSICCNLFAQASLLLCGHSFCYGCIRTWLIHAANPYCPICRELVCASLQPSVSLNNLSAQVIYNKSFYDDDDVKDWEATVQSSKGLMSQDLESLNKLKKRLEKASEYQLSFLDITMNWSDSDRRRFLVGSSAYDCANPSARILYCASTGLSLNFISSASVSQLLLSLRNVFGNADDCDRNDLRAIRLKLLRFVWANKQKISS